MPSDFKSPARSIIPKVVNGRNKLFWMLAYEGMRQRSADPGLVNVPQLDWRTGDFSSLLNAGVSKC